MAKKRPPPPTASDVPELAAPPPRALADRWWGKIVLLLIGVVLLTLAFAPFKQFYAAYFGLVPWLLVVRHCRGPWRAMGWSWVGGVFFFTANMWWLVFVTGPGLAALMAMLALFWAAAGWVMWPLVRLDRAAQAPPLVPPGPERVTSANFSPLRGLSLTLAIPAIWVAFEWARALIPFGGLPWLYLAHTQTPAIYMCQVADLTGEAAVSFWVAMVNALVALFVIKGWRPRGLITPAVSVAAVTAFVLAYGIFRFWEFDSVTAPGPTVLVVQPNFPQDNSGEKGASLEEIIDFHVAQTHAGIHQAPQSDLVVWSETMMPPLNPEALRISSEISRGREFVNRGIDRYRMIYFTVTVRPPHLIRSILRASLYPPPAPIGYGDDWGDANKLIQRLAISYHCGLLVGGRYVPISGDEFDEFSHERNSAYFFRRSTGAPGGRYDKIHRVPFGEYIPFKESWPWLYRQMLTFGPPDMERYQLAHGDEPVVFRLAKDRLTPSDDPARNWRFVTPICFEDIDGELVARLFRGGGPAGQLPTEKAADFIVNITNDGWFHGSEMALHLQNATFRSIENRAPTARAVNTGISAFIDSMGRTSEEKQIPVGTEGTLASQLMLDSRTTFFTKWGNLLGPSCGIVTGLLLTVRLGRWFLKSRT